MQAEEILQNNYLEEYIIAANQNIDERDFWLDKLSGKLVKTNFPYDFKKTDENENAYSFDETGFYLPGEVFSALMKISNGSDYTLNTILAAAVVVLLHKYTGSNDIIVGAPIYKQDLETELINKVLTLRNRLEDHLIFKELLIKVSQTIMEATENYNYPVELLLEQLNIPFPGNGDFPLFDVAVLLENIHDKGYIKYINTNMIFSFLRVDEGIKGILEYNVLRYNRETIERIVSHLVVLLENAVVNIDVKLSGIGILSEEEKRLLLFDFNDTETAYPGSKTLHKLFEEEVEKTPDIIAVVWRDQQVSYGELNERANRIARILRSRGVGPDRIVGLLIKRSIDMIVSILGILKAGGAYLPIDPDTPKNRIVSMMEDCQASVILTSSDVVSRHSFAGLQNIQLTQLHPWVTPGRPQILDFDGLPLPDRSLVNYEAYNQFIGQAMVKNCISLQATRGCPYNCAYCHKIWPKKHVPRSAENIFKEVKLYYKMGVRRFAFIDDIFNLDRENSEKFLNLIIENGLDVKLYFPNGLRGDILTKDYIDLMIKAGTINVAFALETASPRLQKLIRKDLNLEKFRENLEYIVTKYPHIILELFTMHGFPSETEEEAMMTLNFIQGVKWLHFPYVFILKIFPKTDMAALALDTGISAEAIAMSDDLVFHELPETLPFQKNFTLKYQADFFNNYFLSKDRLRQVLPYQMRVLTENEIVQKYNSYLPKEILSFTQLLEFIGLKKEELGINDCLDEEVSTVHHLNKKIREHFPINKPDENALNVLLLDLSQSFSESSDRLRDLIEPPLGLMYVMTYINHCFGRKINGKTAKAQIDFENYGELKALLEEFKPDVIGIRVLSFYKNFFHQSVAMIREWGIDVPVIAGGPYATSGYASLLQDKNVDLVVLGEGEITFGELIKAILENSGNLPDEEVLKEIKGIAFIPWKERKKEKWGRQIIMVDGLPDKLPGELAANPEHINQSSDLAYIIFTSGSTGKPKGILTTHYNAVRVVKNTNYIELVKNDRVLQLSNYSFDGCIFDIYGALLNGAALVLMSGNAPIGVDEVAYLLRKERITVFFLTTALFNMLVRLQPECLQDIRKVLFGGERVSLEWTSKALEYLGKDRIIHMYGPTETTVFATFYPVKDIYGQQETVPIGRPLSNTTVYILDKNLMPVPIGGYGEIYIGGEGLARGYLNNPKLAGDKFVDNPFKKTSLLYKTGDLARWLPTGYVEFIGRIDQQVKIRGFRIEPGEIENQLLKHKNIKEAVVLVRQAVEGSPYHDAESGDRYLCAYFVADKTLEVQDLKNYLARELPAFMIPPYIEGLAEMPLTPNGKIDRTALPPPQWQWLGTYVPPADEVEKKLTEIWAEVLKAEEDIIGVNTNFFDLGGNSLNSTLLVSKIHQEFHTIIPLKNIFTAPTVRELAESIRKVTQSKFVSIEASEEKEYYPLSSAQERLFILQHMDAAPTSYNIPIAVLLEGCFERRQAEETLNRLVKRHESLRTSFEMHNGQPVQKIHQDIQFEMEYSEAGSMEEIIRAFVHVFDLSRAPLIRTGVRKVEEEKHVLMVDMHHIIADGTSLGLFVQDFTALYSWQVLPKLRLQYRDFTQWQNKLINSGELERQEEYWKKDFEGTIPVLTLPTDYPPPEIQHFDGSSVEFIIERENTAVLKRIARTEEATLFMVLLSIFKILLSRLSGQEDIIVGTPVAGRRHADLEHIIGMFVNTLAIRSFPGAEKTFVVFLREVEAKTLEAFENQEYQFEDLVQQLEINRDPSRNPLFDVMFGLQHMENLEVEIPGLQLTSLKFEEEQSKFDMTWTGAEVEETLCFRVVYCVNLFKESTIERFTRYYKRIVTAVVKKPGITISEIEILSEQEKRKMLHEFNISGAEYSRDKTVNRLFDEQVEKAPENTAVVFEEERLTYNEANQRINRLAGILRGKGVTSDTVVGIKVDPSIDMLIGIMAILKAGGAFLPIEVGYPEERIAYMLVDSNCSILLVKEPFNEKLKFNGEILSTVCHDRVYQGEPAYWGRISKPASLLYMIYTSGTTGRPKGVAVSHKNLVNYITWFSKECNITEADRTMLISSYAFDLGYTAIFSSVLNGGQLHLIAKETYLSTEKLMGYINENEISYLKVTPSLFTTMVNSPTFSAESCGILRLVVLGGEKIIVRDVARAYAVCQHLRAMNHYGPTEATIGCIAQFIDRDRLDEYEKNPVIGKPIGNMKAYILGKNLTLQPVGVGGELCLAGDGLARGYLNKPAVTAETFVANPYVEGERLYRTGDLARWMPDGTVDFLGRIDQQVKIRGFRIELDEIKNQLLAHEDIKEVTALVKEKSIGTGGRAVDKYICVYFLADKEPDVKELRGYLSRKLPSYMIPSHFIYLDTFLLTPNGKLDVRRFPDSEPMGMAEERIAPADDLEQELATIWANVLDVEPEEVSTLDNFFEKGGHSLKATILITEIHQALDVQVPLAEIFRNPTIMGLAQYLRQAASDKYTSIELAEEREYYPLSSAQKGLYIQQQIIRKNIAYNMPRVLPLLEDVDTEKFKQVFNKLVWRHESLRTFFILVNGEPVQRITRGAEVRIEYHDCRETREGSKESLNRLVNRFVRPFDLTRAPILRVGLIRIEEKKYVLVADMHHIITDGISNRTLMKEFMALYHGEALPEMEMQYKDYSVWQNNQHQRMTRNKQKAWWLNEYKGGIPRLTLPYDHERPVVMSRQGNHLEFFIESELKEKLQELANNTGTTLFMVLLAAYYILLSRYSRQEDIVVGAPVVGRRHVQLQNIIGMFVNMLAIRNAPGANKSIKKFLLEIKDKVIGAMENQDYHFEELVAELGLHGDLGRNPLFDAVFAMHNIEMGEIGAIPLIDDDTSHITEYDFHSNMSRFDLLLNALEVGDTIKHELHYSTTLFEISTIKDMAKHFVEALRQMVEDPDMQLKGIEMTFDLVAMEPKKLLEDEEDFGF
jgi:amino acid adenylation domain-containing protein